MHSLVYVSSATELFDRAELDEILAVSRRNNATVGVTGMLLYKDGNLMQALEGDQADVQATYHRISTDPRHRGLMVLLEETVEERQFEDWTMAFRDLEATDVQAVPGYSQFLNTSFDDPGLTNDPSAPKQLLTVFRNAM